MGGEVSQEVVDELAKRLVEFEDRQHAEKHVMEQARKTLGQLEDTQSLAIDNKKQLQDLLKLFQDETQSIREWASQGLGDLRFAMRSKMEEVDAMSSISDLRGEIRACVSQLSKQTSYMEVDLRSKADANDVLKLKHAVDLWEEPKPKHLLLGTKCLACDRVALAPEVTERGVADAEHLRQQEGLYRDVQRVLRKQAQGAPGTDILRYVSVHVGSPARPGGGIEVRDTKDWSSGTHSLVQAPKTPRPGVRNEAACATAGQGLSPPREPPPLVRVTPRRRLGTASERRTLSSGPTRPLSRTMPGGTTLLETLGASTAPVNVSTNESDFKQTSFSEEPFETLHRKQRRTNTAESVQYNSEGLGRGSLYSTRRSFATGQEALESAS